VKENPEIEECLKKYSLGESELVSYARPIAADGISIQERKSIGIKSWNRLRLLGRCSPAFWPVGNIR